MTAIAIAIIQMLAPSLLTGTIGTIIGILQTPGAGTVIALGKKAARGDHLNDQEKAIFKEYNRTHYRSPFPEIRH